jgi:hypothetical protein
LVDAPLLPANAERGTAAEDDDENADDLAGAAADGALGKENDVPDVNNVRPIGACCCDDVVTTTAVLPAVLLDGRFVAPLVVGRAAAVLSVVNDVRAVGAAALAAIARNAGRSAAVDVDERMVALAVDATAVLPPNDTTSFSAY